MATTFNLGVVWQYSDATVTKATALAIAAEYSHGPLNSNPTCISYNGFMLYETQITSQEESGCALIYNKLNRWLNFYIVHLEKWGSRT